MSALCLRTIACIAMLLDHLGYLFSARWPELTVLRWIGRIAFPLYVFLLVNGYRHTRSRDIYALRLMLLALLSQIPFSLCLYGQPFYPRLNVYVTLLCALLAIWAGDTLRQLPAGKLLRFLPPMLLAAALHFSPIPMDYGAKGVLLTLIFWLFPGKPFWMAAGMLLTCFYPNLLQTAAWLAHLLAGEPAVPPAISQWELVQLWALAALPLVRLYNGQRGYTPRTPIGQKGLQWAYYLFYPIHFLVLYALR